jgi:hypothetical protein
MASSSSGAISRYSPLPTSYSFDDVGALDLVTGLSVNLAILDPVSGLLVKLVKANLLSLAARREQRGSGQETRDSLR